MTTDKTSRVTLALLALAVIAACALSWYDGYRAGSQTCNEAFLRCEECKTEGRLLMAGDLYASNGWATAWACSKTPTATATAEAREP